MQPCISVSMGLVLALGAALPAAAQERSFNFALRGGVGVAPDYPGSDNYSAQPDVGFSFGALKWGRIDVGNGIGNIPDNGVSLRGAFKVLGSRRVSDDATLAGLSEIDTAVELGFGLVYQQTNWMAFGEVRQGFGGHHGVTGTLGADLILRPTDRWTVTAGPRVNFGNTEYAQTYFGVPTATPSFTAFNADGGVLGAGVAIGATYQINDVWAMESLLSYEKLMNSAADSPITLGGSDDQLSLRIGLSRAFTLRF